MSGNAGESWKARREAMGKTLEDVGLALHIGQRYLRGIEEGNYDGWPEKVFSTGFIRSYAKYLSVDPGSVLAEYEATQGKAAEEEEQAPAPRPEWLEREKERGSRKTTYIFAAGVVLLLGVVLAVLSMRPAERQAPAPPEAAAPRAPASDNTPAAADNAAMQAAAAPAAPAAGGAQPGDRAEAASADNAAPAAAPTVSAVGGAGPLTGPFQLFLEASEQTWVMYSFDGGDAVDVTLFVGDKISISAEKRITLKIGNAGGVVGTLNGQRLPPFGESGQVRNITIGQ
jgi:cytoskeleton protein RodZ